MQVMQVVQVMQAVVEAPAEVWWPAPMASDEGGTLSGSGTDSSPVSPDPAVDAGVERLLSLLWLFQAPGQRRRPDEIEACGYPDIHGANSAGRRNFLNDRDRLASLGIQLQQADDRSWTVIARGDELVELVDAAERDALLAAELIAGKPGPAAPGNPGQRGNPGNPGNPGESGRITSPVPEFVPTLAAASADGALTSFGYDGSTRRVLPCRVRVTRAGRWYLHAVDVDLGAERTYRIDRIDSFPDVDRTTVVDPRWRAMAAAADAGGRAVHPTSWPVDARVEASVRFDHDPLPEWIAMLGAPVDRTSPDGSGRVTLTWSTTHHLAFVSRVLAIGPAAELVGPPPLRGLLLEVLASHAARAGG